ncbi:glycerol-3-phosphate acyltransferase [Deinococcus multiflagellatus]|uniref:glycerol-3-phosphate acyltransferase n=1 Tax=Deinococcus multiflagellatus TaxID=1656887 RepID=UPI001CCA3DD4|nr:glycerol-3-phosphate acyltransferase [Deinococcus multiflagellatus]MBZ9713008.1 glycerol-3-phosphate acyltransferase [Deinococcus multiflagellatus]
MVFLSALLLLVAFLVGTLPAGQTLLSRAGVNVRMTNAHNLGVENVLHLVGPRLALLSALLDAAKGFVAVLMASSLGRPEVTVLAALAAYLGHLNPPRALYGQTPPRGRGNLLLLGVLSALAVTGAVPLWVAALPVVVYAGVAGYWGFVSAATLAGLLAFALAVALLPLGPAAKLGALALLVAATWRFKENLGRLLDGTEPRLGEPVPLAGRRPDEVVAAFMIHPMTLENFWSARRFAWLRPLVERGVISEKGVRQLAESMRPMKVGELHGIRTTDGKRIRCYLLSSPLLPDVFRDQPELATRRAIEGARLAQELGAEVFGLGAFWSVVGNKGVDVQAAVPDITVTNGGAYTSGTIKAAIPGILEHFAAQGRNLKDAAAGVVGANGVVAFGIARTIAPQVGKLIMVGRDLERLERSAATLRRAAKDTEIITTTSYEPLKEADLIFSATSDPNPVIFPQHVKPGAWIFDEGRPADVDDSVLTLPGVRVIPGGVVRPPGGMTSNIDLQFGEGQVPACLAETLIIAATGEHWRKSLGPQTLTENINFFVDQAQKLGFQVVD